ncbi:hypothetical protein HZF05_14790 [Sphingomonas sp. CGMCC 1.13654]|uniref:Yip1 domain-containing protein n=1 Tax=Sphingomonas chungangi TaxID=2683589 RepID=A0A838L7Q9_9SPHN|nr:hypothetical protein [Sphingomonas chungangi]MBA2935351.1 hypothetical protein [Sphingomonas chungangi]MVW56857.1 hypothetical protein [Sphingomonas chungangi]
MDLSAALDLIKSYAKMHGEAFLAFFKRDSAQRWTFEQVFTGGLIYLILGVTLQDRFISDIRSADIQWIDRALVEAVFWVTIGILVEITLRLMRATRDHGLLVTFRVMPIAFLCGAYAGALGYLFCRGLAFFNLEFRYLPPIVNMSAQLTIIAAYMPAKFRRYCGLQKGKSISAAAVVFLTCLVVDSVVVFGPLVMSILYGGKV